MGQPIPSVCAYGTAHSLSAACPARQRRVVPTCSAKPIGRREEEAIKAALDNECDDMQLLSTSCPKLRNTSNRSSGCGCSFDPTSPTSMATPRRFSAFIKTLGYDLQAYIIMASEPASRTINPPEAQLLVFGKANRLANCSPWRARDRSRVSFLTFA